MPGTIRAGSYRALFGSAVVTRTFALAMVGRFGYAVLPLVLLFTIAQATGSFATAATASAVYGLSGLAMPLQARLIDRFTQRRVLPIAGLCAVLTLVAMAAFGARSVTEAPPWIALCLVSGLVTPALGPSMRAQWRVVVPEAARPVAYSLDAVAEEVVFLLGPVAATGVLATGPAWRGLAPAGTLILVGALGLALGPAARHRSNADHRSRDLWGPWRQPRFGILLVVMALAGAGLAAALTGTAGRADLAGKPAWAGVIEIGAGITAVLGGLAWGRWAPRSPWNTQLAALLLVRSAILVPAVLLSTLPAAAVAMVVGGLLLSPVFVVGYLAADRLTPPHQHTEASTWVTTSTNLGSSLGTAAAGWAVAHGGPAAPFAVAAAVLASGAIVAWTIRRGSARQ